MVSYLLFTGAGEDSSTLQSGKGRDTRQPGQGVGRETEARRDTARSSATGTLHPRTTNPPSTPVASRDGVVMEKGSGDGAVSPQWKGAVGQRGRSSAQPGRSRTADTPSQVSKNLLDPAAFRGADTGPSLREQCRLWGGGG